MSWFRRIHAAIPAVTITPGAPALAARGISKRFGATVANDAVDFDLRAGEIHALLGENGAGKTTLLSIIGGLYQPDAGTLTVGGAPAHFSQPGDAIARGISTVHQHFTLAPSLTVLENVALGFDHRFTLDLDRIRDQTLPTLDAFGLGNRLDDEVRHLSLGERQRLEIAKALARGSRILLLDEPTSILSPGEVDEFFAILRRLAGHGVAIVIVTHKLDEAISISDRITILRRGRVSGTLTQADLAAMPEHAATKRIVSLMFATETPEAAAVAAVKPGRVLLAVERISIRTDRGLLLLRDCSLDLRAGEITGLAGVDGNGQRELAEAIAGQRSVETGTIRLEARDLTGLGVAERRALGVAYLTDDRLGEGCVADLSVAENLALTRLPGRFWLDRRALETQAAQLIDAYDIRTSSADRRIGDLSGGNIQKVLLARELSQRPAVLIANKPAHGLDTRTAAQIRARLREQADAGAAVLLIESDLDDLLPVCDRIAVMAAGLIAGIFARHAVDLAEIGRLMVGAA
jgi:simple sugar transport system ATP-binding protein